MANLKVLMMGGRRCGKTSALASLFDQMTNTQDIYSLLTVADKTILEVKTTSNGDEEKQEKLANKKLELQSFLKKYTSSDFLVDKGPTKNYWLYKMQIALAGTSKTMMMEFRDAAGEFFDHGGQHTTETLKYVQDCDVFIVVIDTPYLMCDDDAVCDAANVTDSIHSFLTSIDKDSNNNQELSPRMVMFVPIKCEKWLHEGKISDVNDKIKAKYAPTIQHLMARGEMEISIVPVETAGGIEFSEMREAWIISSNGGRIIGKDNKPIGSPDFPYTKCSKTTSKTYILENGVPYALKDGDLPNLDPEAVFKFDNEDLDIPRPASWYHLWNNAPKYQPHNCEQIALHVLRFYLNVTKKHRNGGWWERFLGRFGRITLQDLNNTIVELYNRGMIKDDKDGIERLMKYQ